MNIWHVVRCKVLKFRILSSFRNNNNFQLLQLLRGQLTYVITMCLVGCVGGN